MAATVTPLLELPDLRLGRFRCPPSHPQWRNENWIGARAHVVFPERPVTITRAATGPQIGDRNWALLYEPGQYYRRELVDPAGDECTFVELSDRTYAELVDSRDDVSRAYARRAFTAGRVLVHDSTWLGYQEVLAATPGASASVEDRLRAVLIDLLGRTSPVTLGLDVDPEPGVTNDPRVYEACRMLATDLEHRVTLIDAAEAVGLSRFHFARLFRTVTGLSIHAYRQRLQLRAAFASCATTQYRTLSEVAIAAGYASHSHMTSSFRRSLRMSPSAVRLRFGRNAAAIGRGEPTLIG